MAEEGQAIRGINWRETFPFTNIFRAFRIAIHPSKLLLALAALLLIYLGGRVLDRIWPDKHLAPAGWPAVAQGRAADSGFAASSEHEATVRTLDRLMEAVRTGEMTEAEADAEVEALDRRARQSYGHSPTESAARRGIFISFFTYEVAQVNAVAAGVLAGNWLGIGGVRDSVMNFLATGPLTLYHDHPLYAILFTIWFLLVWSVFGGAIARIAAVHVAREEKLSVRQALRFSIAKVLSFLFAPIIPLVIVLVVGVVVAVGGLAMYIPVLGPILVGLLLVLSLAAGFVMTLLLLGTIGGFNLMYPTIAVEGSDSFDAISRSFSYVYARPWRMLFYTIVAIIYGALTYLFVRLFIYLMLALTHFFMSWWLGDQTEPGRYWNLIWPEPNPIRLPYDVNYGALAWSEATSAGLISFWVYLVISMLGAYAISFYFSANTIIYYLMRREVDATELDDVFLEQSEEDFGETAPVTSSPTAAPAAGAEAPAATTPPAETSTDSSPPPAEENPGA